MSETFFIGDTHFGHKSIIKFEAETRPFETLDEMHEELIRRWNSVVRKGDRVLHLGDFCFGTKNIEFAGRLNGLKYLIMGNHDTGNSAAYLRHFHKLLGAMEFDGCILTHIPVHESQFPRYRANIHGHSHSKNINDPRYINVSCEQINLTPISYADLKLRLPQTKVV